ncbi:hypothetical protein BDW22DRAFT_706677 [Trametopsis cervina]|nr:hypothetical protein BDW22DRAFT_706677 [Trametopsis cervina]
MAAAIEHVCKIVVGMETCANTSVQLRCVLIPYFHLNVHLRVGFRAYPTFSLGLSLIGIYIPLSLLAHSLRAKPRPSESHTLE